MDTFFWLPYEVAIWLSSRLYRCDNIIGYCFQAGS